MMTIRLRLHYGRPGGLTERTVTSFFAVLSDQCVLLRMILLEVLGLFEDVFVNLVAVDRWVAVIREQDD
jgi:hypothetical protein